MGKALLGYQNPFLLLTFSFLHLGPPFLSYLHHNLFLNSSLAYYLLALLPLGPQVVNYHFTLDFIINSESLVLFPENSYLTFIIP